MTIIDILLDQMQSRGLMANEQDAMALYRTVLNSIVDPSPEVLEALCKGEFDHGLGLATCWDDIKKFADDGSSTSIAVRNDHLVRMRAGLLTMVQELFKIHQL